MQINVSTFLHWQLFKRSGFLHLANCLHVLNVFCLDFGNCSHIIYWKRVDIFNSLESSIVKILSRISLSCFVILFQIKDFQIVFCQHFSPYHSNLTIHYPELKFEVRQIIMIRYNTWDNFLLSLPFSSIISLLPVCFLKMFSIDEEIRQLTHFRNQQGLVHAARSRFRL